MDRSKVFQQAKSVTLFCQMLPNNRHAWTDLTINIEELLVKLQTMRITDSAANKQIKRGEYVPYKLTEVDLSTSLTGIRFHINKIIESIALGEKNCY